MKVEISYKMEGSSIPYCAFARVNGSYLNEWSTKSFEDAKQKLIASIKALLRLGSKTPPTETVEIEIEQPKET